MFYLKARGIDSKEAVKMIIKGFLETVLEKINNKEKMNILLPKSKGTRNVILIQPKNFCPEIYPRKVGKPEKNPL